MKLAIADPPYLGRGRIWYTEGGGRTGFRTNGTMSQSADHHTNARAWDTPARHQQLVADITADYDGWAIAMSRDSLHVYLAAAPTARVAVWHNPAAWPPGGSRVHSTWEPVLIHIPEGRHNGVGHIRVKDVLIAIPPRHLGFIGSKPPEWTRWVLDMLGYNPDTDTITDLFPGSGAVTREAQQTTLL